MTSLWSVISPVGSPAFLSGQKKWLFTTSLLVEETLLPTITCTAVAISSVFMPFYVDHDEPHEALAFYKTKGWNRMDSCGAS